MPAAKWAMPMVNGMLGRLGEADRLGFVLGRFGRIGRARRGS